MMPQPRLEKIDLEEALRYLGCAGQEVPRELRRSVERCAETVLETARPRVTYRVLSWSGERLEGAAELLTGRDIRAHLKGCRQAVLLAATLGPDVERLLMRTQVTDMAAALMLDACASAAVEALCDGFEADLRAEYAREGRGLTGRFSPGYGDLPLSAQSAFCELLDTRRRIGLTVSQSGILIPRKSVTAVMGVADAEIVPHRRSCAQCSRAADCPYRKNGGACARPEE